MLFFRDLKPKRMVENGAERIERISLQTLISNRHKLVLFGLPERFPFPDVRVCKALILWISRIFVVARQSTCAIHSVGDHIYVVVVPICQHEFVITVSDMYFNGDDLLFVHADQIEEVGALAIDAHELLQLHGGFHFKSGA